jgi:hypothetical protein
MTQLPTISARGGADDSVGRHRLTDDAGTDDSLEDKP